MGARLATFISLIRFSGTLPYRVHTAQHVHRDWFREYHLLWNTRYKLGKLHVFSPTSTWPLELYDPPKSLEIACKVKLNDDVYFPVSHKNLFQYIKVTIKTRSKKQFQKQAVPFSVPKKKKKKLEQKVPKMTKQR